MYLHSVYYVYDCQFLRDVLFVGRYYIKSNEPYETTLLSITLFYIYRTRKGSFHCTFFNPIQDGVGQKGPPTSFFPVTSTNVRIGPQNFLTFSFNPFATLVQNFKFVPSASPKLLNLNQDHPSGKAIFPVKSL